MPYGVHRYLQGRRLHTLGGRERIRASGATVLMLPKSWNRSMKFALVNGERREAEPSLMGECLGCGNPVVAKCGEVRIKHWAHKARARCDAWWETETEWHRAWKNQFPSEWQEVIHYAENGEKHIADAGSMCVSFRLPLTRRDLQAKTSCISQSHQ